MGKWRNAVLVFFGVLILTLVGVGVYLDRGLPDVGGVQDFRPDGSLQMQAADGTVIYNKGSGPQARATAAQIPKVLREATIASEDRRFYEHNGVDLAGIGRAVVNNFRQGELAEGGSTITQQLARILFLNRDKNLSRKFQEALLALKIEQTYSKDEILVFYLNYSYFGAGAYGVADASRVYFNKSVNDINLSEAALLIGVLPAPSVYSPLNNLELARKRRDVVLNKMVRAGFLKETEAKQSMAQQPRYRFNRARWTANSYFTSYVEGLLPSLVGRDVLEQGGLVVMTTLDAEAQAIAQKTLSARVKSFRRVSQGALVSLDPTTGAIRALVGGVDFTQSQFNRATQARRQPGSAFKTFVYLTALEQGYAPTRVYVDRPLAMNGYSPKNSDGRFLGPLNLMEALAKSRNPVAVELLLDVGIAQTIATCRRLGITTDLRPDATLALGSSEVQLLEFTSAYGVLANGGIRVAPVAVLRVQNRQGRVIYEAKPSSEVVVDPQVSWMMTQMLRRVVTHGTGRAARVSFQAAGKTGTSDRGRDLLFVGYTPRLVTGVWLGNDDEAPTGGSSSLAAQVWGQFMRQVGQPSPDFKEPPDLNSERKGQILASVQGETTSVSRPRRESTAIGELPAPAVEEPSEEPLVLADPAPPSDDQPLVLPEPELPSSVPELSPSAPDCYDPVVKAQDRRCRNRKN
ncbi:transglycosylase domain-containing protein [Candidatus Cyanaurora vandensis]|uniref:transglycosylase domain-containing protein n=1 Tax=Candidatus Cyanaurora vandensis TaxID=2714958 RepID=UPI00257B1853|nr:PBP1A family penicillin-binding protein [Candidatus Cyanaurora vandensis]